MRALAVIGMLLLTAAPALAGTDGARGSTSTAAVGVSTLVENAAENVVRVSGLPDFDFGLVTIEDLAAGGGARAISACLYHTSQTFTLTVTQTGGGVGAPFQLRGPSGGAIPFTVRLFNVSNGAQAPAAVGFSQNGLVANRQDPNCEQGGRAAIELARLPVQPPVPGGSYSATLSLVMAIE